MYMKDLTRMQDLGLYRYDWLHFNIGCPRLEQYRSSPYVILTLRVEVEWLLDKA